MSPHDSYPPEDFDALLTPAPTSANGALQQSILRQTTGVVRRRRYVRRLIQVAALVVCYAAGAVTMRLGTPAPTTVVVRIEQPRPSTATPEVPSPPRKVVAPPKPSHTEPPLSPYERLRRFSDRVLEEKGDIPLAARYYAMALRKATTEERAITSGDSWLLMAVKRDRTQEKSDVQHGS